MDEIEMVALPVAAQRLTALEIGWRMAAEWAKRDHLNAEVFDVVDGAWGTSIASTPEYEQEQREKNAEARAFLENVKVACGGWPLYRGRVK